MTAADMVVKEQAEPQQPGRAKAVMMRQHKAKRADNVGRDSPENLAFDQRLADQAELVIFEIAQAAMHEIRRPRRRPARQVIHFTEENRIAAPDRVTRDAAAVDAAPNDQEVENPVQGRFPALAYSFWRFYFRFRLNHNQIRKQQQSRFSAGRGLDRASLRPPNGLRVSEAA